MNNIEIAKQNAKANIKRMQDQLPHKLATKEKNLYKNFKKDRSEAISKLKKLYAFMDELYEYVNKFTPCKGGCAHCCHYPVTVSELEIENIKQHTGHNRSLDQPIKIIHDLPCPLLINNVCSIYNARPYVCRRHITFERDSKWCQIDVCNKFDLPMVRFSEIDKTYEQILVESGSAKWEDIRGVFMQQF